MNLMRCSGILAPFFTAEAQRAQRTQRNSRERAVRDPKVIATLNSALSALSAPLRFKIDFGATSTQ